MYKEKILANFFNEDMNRIKKFQKLVNIYIKLYNETAVYPKGYIKVDGIEGGEVRYWKQYFKKYMELK